MFRFLLLAVCVIAYVVSFFAPVLPASYMDDTFVGVDAFAGAFRSDFPHSTSTLHVWAANPVFWCGLTCLGFGRMTAAALAGVWAFMLGSLGLFAVKNIAVFGSFGDLMWGYWLWVASMGALAFAPLLPEWQPAKPVAYPIAPKLPAR